MDPLENVSDDEISDAVHACLTDVIGALNRHPHPAVQITAMATALGKLLHMGTGSDMGKEEDVRLMLKDFSERTLQYWQGFASGLFDQEKVQ